MLDNVNRYNVHWFRGLADGCRTFDEILDNVEARKNRITKLKKMGCTIKYSRDDYILVEIPEGAVENYCTVIGMTPDELFVDYILVEIPEGAVENYCTVIGMTPDELFVIQDGV